MMFGMKKVETFGGIGSILGGLMCVGIGLMDYFSGQSWKIWAVMTVVLVINGIAMLITASKRPEGPVPESRVQGIARART